MVDYLLTVLSADGLKPWQITTGLKDIYLWWHEPADRIAGEAALTDAGIVNRQWHTGDKITAVPKDQT